MKVRVKREGKFNLSGKQYRQGDILEIENITDLPENWIEPVRKEEVEEDKPKEFVTEKDIKEVIKDGNNKVASRNLDSKKR